MIFNVLLFCFVLYLLYYYFTRTFGHWKKKKVNGPKPTPLFGNFMNVTLMRDVQTFQLKKICDKFPNEPIIGVYRMTTPWLIIRDLDIVKHVLIKDFDMFSDRGVPVASKKLSQNLFVAKSDSWRVLRHQFTPLFTTGKLKNMFHLINEKGDAFLNYIDSISQKTPDQELHPLIQLYTLSTISACAFGLDVELSGSNTIMNSFRNIDSIIFQRRPIQEFGILYPKFFNSLVSSLNFSRLLDDFFSDLVATVVKQRNGKSINRNDFMDLLLDLRNQGQISSPKREGFEELTLEITDDIMAAQAFIFYLAGYETSATTMSFMLYELSRNPHIQEKLHQEVDEIVRKGDGQITYEALGQLPYMEKVFDETLRKHPVLDPLMRTAVKDYKIPGTDVVIEKGQVIVVPVRAIHYDETIYPDPQKFDPERFDKKVSAERHSCAYLPFGLGPRNCIGMRFAKVQSRLCMVKLLSRFRVELVERDEITLDLNRAIVGPRKGYKLRFCSRKNKDA